MLRQLYDKANEPLTDLPSRAARALTKGSRTGPQTIAEAERINRAPKIFGVPLTFGTWREELAGMTEGAGDVASGFTSPLNIATTLAGGRALKTGSDAWRTATRLLSAPVAYHGLETATDPEKTAQERLFGVAEAAGGAAGMHFPKRPTSSPYKPKRAISPSRQLGPGKFYVSPEGEIPLSEGPRPRSARERAGGRPGRDPIDIEGKVIRSEEVPPRGGPPKPPPPSSGGATAQDYIAAIKSGQIPKGTSFADFQRMNAPEPPPPEPPTITPEGEINVTIPPRAIAPTPEAIPTPRTEAIRESATSLDRLLEARGESPEDYLDRIRPAMAGGHGTLPPGEFPGLRQQAETRRGPVEDILGEERIRREIGAEEEEPLFQRPTRPGFWEVDDVRTLSEKDYDALVYRKEKEIRSEQDPERVSQTFLELDNKLKQIDKFPNKTNSDQIEYLGHLRDVALDKYRRTTGALLEGEDVPQFARSGKGGIKVGANIERSAQELTTGYSGALEGIMIREAMQNAIDATRHLGNKGEISVGIGGNDLTVSDNGPGMTKAQLETVFSDLHSSGKATQAGATGGKGVGKASYMLGGERFKAETVTVVKGQKVKYTIEGTPQEFMRHVPIQEQVMPPDTPTGTTIKTTLREGQEPYNVRYMMDEVIGSSRGIQANIKYSRYGGTEPDPYQAPGFRDFYPIENQKIGDNSVSAIIPDKTEFGPRNAIRVRVLNNGMYQFSRYMHLGEETPGLPQSILLDVKPLVDEGDPKYPFPVQRESLKEEVWNQIEEVLKEKLVNPFASQKKIDLQRLYDSMTDFGIRGTARKTVLFDPGDRLLPEELQDFQTSPFINQMMEALDTAFDDIVTRVGREEWSTRLEKVGLVLSPDMHGVFIPNPATKKGTILVNPFIAMSEKIPYEAALDVATTIVHEAAHIGKESNIPRIFFGTKDVQDPRIGRLFQSYINETLEHGGRDLGHGVAFLQRLGEIYAKTGARQILGFSDRIENAFTGLKGEASRSGGYSSEVQRLLQIYSDSRRRPATTEDILSGTGVRSESKPGRKGRSTGSSRPDRIGIAAARDRLLGAIKENKPRREMQEAVYTTGRSQRFKEFVKVGTKGEKGFREKMSKLRGEFDKVPTAAVNFAQSDKDALFDAIISNRTITPAEQARAGIALTKILEGDPRVPQRGELALLDKVYGEGFGGQIMELYGGIGPIGLKIGKTANTMKTLMAGVGDLSAPFRQGLGMIHKKEWRDAFGEMFRYFTSEEAFSELMRNIESRPNYLLAREAGLFLADSSLTGREEQFLNSYVGDIRRYGFKNQNAPGMKGVLGKAARYGTEPIRASERAYVGFLNKLRADVFDSLIADAIKAGHDPMKVQMTKRGTIKSTNNLAEEIANFVNTATGRGPLPKVKFGESTIDFGKMGEELNLAFFSPRLISSRLATLNPMTYVDPKIPAMVRKESLKSLLAIGSFIITANAIGNALGGETKGANVGGVNILNPFDIKNITNSDFGKIKFGNVRLDPGGGYNQYIVAAMRFLSGLSTSPTTNVTRRLGEDYGAPTRLSQLIGIGGREKSFMENKFSPMASFIDTFLTGVDYQGRPTNIPAEVRDRFVPIMAQDLIDIYQEDPKLLPLAIPMTLGMGGQAFEPRIRRGRGMNMMRMPGFGMGLGM